MSNSFISILSYAVFLSNAVAFFSFFVLGWSFIASLYCWSTLFLSFRRLPKSTTRSK